MQTLQFDQIESVLCLGAHPDDIEIGCGGTLLKLLARATVDVTWVVFSGAGQRKQEAEQSASAWLDSCRESRVDVLGFEDGHFPTQWREIKGAMKRLAEGCQPDLIFTHYGDDRHQDHRVISELAWQEFRSHHILEYEIPKFEGDLGHPNFYVALDEPQLNRKLDWLMHFHNSQSTKHWFDEELFRGCARLRGVECASHYAEAFHARKVRFA